MMTLGLPMMIQNKFFVAVFQSLVYVHLYILEPFLFVLLISSRPSSSSS